MKKLLALILLISDLSIASESLNIDSYLGQVFDKNPAYKAAVENSSGAKLRNGESDLLVLPILTLQASQTIDEKDTFTPSVNGTRAETQAYKIALEQYTPFGLHAQLKYEQYYKDIAVPGGTSAAVPVPEYYGGNPSIELTQSLWRNGFGREIRAKRAGIDSGSLATHYAERFKVDGIRVESQMAYIKLFYSRKILGALKESLDVAQKMKDWTKKRLDQDLGDRSDYLQAKAAFEFRQFDLMQAEQDERSSARAFNSLRGVDSEVVVENLSEPKLTLPNLKPYSPARSRDDVRAARKQLEYSRAQAQEGVERGRPSLDLFASYGWTGLDASESKARSEAFADDFPYYTVGVRFQSPLMFGILGDMKEGYEKEVQAAKFNLERKAQEEERDYKDLTDKLNTLSQKLKLAEILEESQREKVTSERLRQRRGKTTLFQVLQFEQDYVDAQLNKYKTEVELKTHVTQLQLYKEDQ